MTIQRKTVMWSVGPSFFAIMVAKARKRTGIEPPTLYPRDSEIKQKQLTPKDVDSYMCAQRVHQNNMEFLTTFLPIMLVAMLAYPEETFKASLLVLAGRMVTAMGYYLGASKRVVGGWFHFGEYYCVYLVGKLAYTLITSEATA